MEGTEFIPVSLTNKTLKAQPFAPHSFLAELLGEIFHCEHMTDSYTQTWSNSSDEMTLHKCCVMPTDNAVTGLI